MKTSVRRGKQKVGQTSVSILQQLKETEKKMRAAEHRVFDYVQGVGSSPVDAKKFHHLSEAARRAANRYCLLAQAVYSRFKRP